MNVDAESLARKAIAREFRDFAESRQPRITGDAAAKDAARLECRCRRPEVGPFLAGTEFALDRDLVAPLRVESARLIRIAPFVLANPVAAAVLLRQAFEIRSLQALMPCQQEPVAQWAIAGLALHCTRKFRDGLVLAERPIAQAGLPGWLAAEDGEEDAARLFALVLDQAEPLAELHGLDREAAARPRGDSALQSAARELCARLLPLAVPTEWLLTQGGDNRLKVDPATGLNIYGCSPKPRLWAVTFASCTGSSISELGFSAAESVRRELLLAAFRGGLAEAVEEQSARIRRELMRELRLDGIPGTEAVPTSSGTDGELAALHVSLAGHDDPLVNILLASVEVGSGTVPAAGGMQFDTQTPLGARVRAGSPVAGLPLDRASLVTVPVRDERGAVRPVADIDRDVLAPVREAVGKGSRVLLHLLDSSKTGMGAPGFPAVRAIQAEFGERVSVVVDTAQMRLSRAVLAD